MYLGIWRKRRDDVIKDELTAKVLARANALHLPTLDYVLAVFADTPDGGIRQAANTLLCSGDNNAARVLRRDVTAHLGLLRTATSSWTVEVIVQDASRDNFRRYRESLCPGRKPSRDV